MCLPPRCSLKQLPFSLHPPVPTSTIWLTSVGAWIEVLVDEGVVAGSYLVSGRRTVQRLLGARQCHGTRLALTIPIIRQSHKGISITEINGV